MSQLDHIMMAFLRDNNRLDQIKADSSEQIKTVAPASIDRLYDQVIKQGKTNNIILAIVVGMFIVVFCISLILMFLYRDQPDMLKILLGGSSFSVLSVVYGLLRVWKQKTQTDYLLILIPNLPPEHVAQIIETLIYQAKIKKG